MGIDISPYREALAPPLMDYTEWETGALREHIQGMLTEKEYASWHRAEELERQIQHGCFEIARRRADYERFREAAQAAGHAAIPEVAC